MRVWVNGEPRDLRDGTTVAELVRALGLEGRPVAVEVNRRVVPKAEHGARRVGEGDRIEVVHFVGGG